ncbi:MAG: hypothetical protein R2728_10955 [Chitinophagales bacterium]
MEFCNVLRDDGVTYHQYLNELTYILFTEIKEFDEQIPEEYQWKTLLEITDNKELFDRYRNLLANISKKADNNTIKEIYTNVNNIT